MRDLYNIGKITGTFGLKGYLKIIENSNLNVDWNRVKEIYIFGINDKFIIENINTSKNTLKIKVKDIDDIQAAEQLVGRTIYVEEIPEIPLDKNEFLIKDLISCDVEFDKIYIGKVKDVNFQPKSEILIVVNSNEEEAMIPFIKEYIDYVDILNKKIYLKNIISGLIPWL